MKRVRLSTLFVLDLSFCVIGVRAGLFWVRVACVPSSSLHLIVYTSSWTCFATRIALCVCCFLSTSSCGRLAPLFEGRYRAIPSVAMPRCVGRGCGAGFVGAVMGPCFVYVSCAGRLDLLAIDGVRAVVRCRGHRFGGALSRQRFLKSVFFLPCVFPSQ